jgi:E3 ubiquitin-protein ligase HACE1
MLCGVADIDINDWKDTCQYHDGLNATSAVAVWFWTAVREMSREERSALLHFCTGSVRVPAQGFTSLMGYGGQQQRFTLSCSANPDAGRLPTASTCFNKLYLPAYTSLPELKAKLLRVLTKAGSFDEAAVA